MKVKAATFEYHPVHRNGKTIIDEMCQCGHARTQHGHTVAYGHGSCEAQCDCPKFTWNGWVFAKRGTV